MSNNQRMHFDLVTDSVGLAALGQEWQMLEVAHGSEMQLFQTFAWQDAWWHSASESEQCQLRIVVGRLGNELVLVWPLIEKCIGPVHILQQGSGVLACYDDLIVSAAVDKNDWIEAAWRFALSMPNVDVLQLQAVHTASALHAIVERDGGKPISSTSAPVIATDKDVSDYFSGRSKGMRKRRRRTWKALNRLGVVRAAINDSQISYSTAVATLLNFKRDWIQAHGLRASPLVDSGGEAFLKAFNQRCKDHPALRVIVSTLLLDEKLIAVGIGFQLKRRYYDYCGAFDPKYSHIGCGRAQMEMAIRHCFDSDVDNVDLLTPETAGKRCWTHNLPVVSQYAVPRSKLGWLYVSLYLRHVRPMLKRVSAMLPVRWRQYIQR